MVDKDSYNTANITDTEGVVLVNYYDNESKELIKKQAVSGEIGQDYDINDLASSLNYDVKSSSGDTQGMFTDSVLKANVYVKNLTVKPQLLPLNLLTIQTAVSLLILML